MSDHGAFDKGNGDLRATGRGRMNKVTRKLQFDQKTREKIYRRDGFRCIFCNMGFYMNSTTEMGYQLDGIMHYIPRSQMGLGIEENGALGCHYHHQLMDNGNKGLREEMLCKMEEYLKRRYKDWDPKKLIYRKGE